MMIRSRRMRGAGHVARMGDKKSSSKFWQENVKERDYLEDVRLDGTIILKRI
jgi:hypothetical protein